MPTPEIIKRDALAFLKEQYIAVVATSFNDEPHASTVYYFVDDSFNFYFITKRNTSKYLNIEMNQNVALVVGTGPEHISVQVRGKGILIVDEIEQQQAITNIYNKLAHEQVKTLPIEEVLSLKGRNKVVFKITPHQMWFMNLDSTVYPDSITNEFIPLT